MTWYPPVLVGSRALEYWSAEGLLRDKEFTCREGADWDVWIERGSTFEESIRKGEDRVEIHYFDELNNRDVYLRFGSTLRCGVNGVECDVLNANGLALIKRSHLWRWHNFDKHITMYHKFLKPYLPLGGGLLKERIELTKKAFPQGNPKLTQTNKDFFDDFVEKEFEHDWLHELVAYYKEPLYTRMKKPEKVDLAWCEKDLWEEFTHEDKIKCVAEEAHVIACERFMIPNKWEFSRKKAYYTAVKKVCTTLCSGWFRSFAIDNFPEVLSSFDNGKFDKVKRETDLARTKWKLVEIYKGE